MFFLRGDPSGMSAKAKAITAKAKARRAKAKARRANVKARTSQSQDGGIKKVRPTRRGCMVEERRLRKED